MSEAQFNLKVLRIAAWMGPGFVATFCIGAFLGGFFPPPSSANAAAVTAAAYTDNLTSVRLGCIIMLFSSALYAPWGLSIAIYTRGPEAGRPILFYTQVASIAITAVDILFLTLFWCFGSFRPDELSIEITQTWNDAGWLALLLTVPPFTVWCFAIAASIFGDFQENPRFPRWVAYFNVWAGMLYLPAAMVLFFKSGPFSQNGVVAFWMPVVVFFIWICSMSYFVLREIGRDELKLARG